MTKLLELEFTSGNIIKPKAMKFIVKEMLPDYRQQWKPFVSVVKKMLQTKIQVLEKLNKLE